MRQTLSRTHGTRVCVKPSLALTEHECASNLVQHSRNKSVRETEQDGELYHVQHSPNKSVSYCDCFSAFKNLALGVSRRDTTTGAFFSLFSRVSHRSTTVQVFLRMNKYVTMIYVIGSVRRILRNMFQYYTQNCVGLRTFSAIFFCH